MAKGASTSLIPSHLTSLHRNWVGQWVHCEGTQFAVAATNQNTAHRAIYWLVAATANWVATQRSHRPATELRWNEVDGIGRGELLMYVCIGVTVTLIGGRRLWLAVDWSAMSSSELTTWSSRGRDNALVKPRRPTSSTVTGRRLDTYNQPHMLFHTCILVLVPVLVLETSLRTTTRVYTAQYEYFAHLISLYLISKNASRLVQFRWDDIRFISHTQFNPSALHGTLLLTTRHYS